MVNFIVSILLAIIMLFHPTISLNDNSLYVAQIIQQKQQEYNTTLARLTNYTFDSRFCSAVVISETKFITAKHCNNFYRLITIDGVEHSVTQYYKLYSDSVIGYFIPPYFGQVATIAEHNGAIVNNSIVYFYGFCSHYVPSMQRTGRVLQHYSYALLSADNGKLLLQVDKHDVLSYASVLTKYKDISIDIVERYLVKLNNGAACSGDSGSGVFNSNDELIGIVSAIRQTRPGKSISIFYEYVAISNVKLQHYAERRQK